MIPQLTCGHDFEGAGPRLPPDPVVTGAEQRAVVPVVVRLDGDTAGAGSGRPVADAGRHRPDVVRAVHSPAEAARRRVRVDPAQHGHLLLAGDAVHQTLPSGTHRRVCRGRLEGIILILGKHALFNKYLWL